MDQLTIEKEFKQKTATARDEWSFAGERSIDKWTHGYHRYPAKFLPQLVKKIIETYSLPGDVIGDVFAGCGTTLVESKAHGLKSIGVDINPVAHLITQAKIHPIDPKRLTEEIFFLEKELKHYADDFRYYSTLHERIDYWFQPIEKNKIAYLYHVIDDIDQTDVRNFFLCGLSNILKSSSRWLQTGTKPQIDPGKEPVDPLIAFSKQVRKMQKKNDEFYAQLKKNNWLNVECEMLLSDARKTSIEAESVSIIITSPPYVTSYEYADIHQLTGYWFNYFSHLPSFRKNFIGTFHSSNNDCNVHGSFASSIVERLSKRDRRLSKEVANYFNDMDGVIKEIKRVLKPSGLTCIVVGNTTMKGIRIKSAESFVETLIREKFSIVELIKRRINHKIMPTIRDRVSGKFTTMDSKNRQRIYPEEYIIIARKNSDEHSNKRS
jgi:DNA modification methylase